MRSIACSIFAFENYVISKGLIFSGGPVAGLGAWNVTVGTNPNDGQFYIMHILEWIRLQKEGKNPIEMMEHVPQGDTTTWSGTHIVYVVFPERDIVIKPRQINLTKNGRLQVNSNGTSTFTADPSNEQGSASRLFPYRVQGVRRCEQRAFDAMLGFCDRLFRGEPFIQQWNLLSYVGAFGPPWPSILHTVY